MNQRLLHLALAAGAAVVLSGCSALGIPGDAPRDDAGAATAAARADAFAVKVGDCLQDPGQEEVSAVRIIPCAEPHQMEVFHGFNLTQGELPATDDEWSLIEEEMCDPAFAKFVGVSWLDSTLETSSLNPTPESWAEGDREVLCMVAMPGFEETTGTLAGSKR